MTAPDTPLAAYLNSLTDADYRARIGPLGMLRLLSATRIALRAYERQAVSAARAEGRSWSEIADALGEPRATVHHRWKRVG
jgi:hypothetical protein